MDKLIKKFNIDTTILIIFAVGIVLRLIAGFVATPDVNQHDVLLRYGHFDYAMYFFKYWRLPDMWGYEFAQPPINAMMQAILMTIINFFHNYGDNYVALYAHTKWLSVVYSIITLLIIYGILLECEEFGLSKKVRTFVLAIMAVYSGNIVMATQYSNDNISYMFFYLSLYLTIRWYKDKKLSTIVKLAFAIGIGMLTKVSVGLIAFITGPIMIYVWVKAARTARGYGMVEAARTAPQGCFVALRSSSSLRERSGALGYGMGELREPARITVQLLIFAIIVFPIGLSFSIRNYVRWGIEFGLVSEIATGTYMDMKNYNWTFVDRFLSLPLDRIVGTETGIYHNFREYNVWIDLIKTATYDEFNFKETAFHGLCVVLYILNYVFYIMGVSTIILNFIDLIRSFYKKDVLNIKKIMYCFILVIFAVAISAYVGYNVKYAYSCNSNYRYIAYITFAFALSIAIKCLQNEKK